MARVQTKVCSAQLPKHASRKKDALYTQNIYLYFLIC